MALPSYVVEKNVAFDENYLDPHPDVTTAGYSAAMIFDTAAGEDYLLVWSLLDIKDKDRLDEWVQAYGGALPIPSTDGYQVIDYGGTVVGGNATGLLGSAGLTAEGADVTTVADVAKSLSGTHWTINSPTVNYYVWYNILGSVESNDFLAVGDTDGSLGGTYFTVNSPSTNYYVWYNVPARTEITNVDFSSHTIVAADYWTLNAPSGAFYVWYDVDASGALDPAPGGTGIKVDILSGDTAAQVATKTAAQINLDANFSCPPPGANIITVTNAANGAVTDAADFNAGVGVTVTQQGITASVDPAPGGTGIQININAGDNADAVAIATANTVDLNGDFNASFTAGGPVGDFNITNVANGNVTDATIGTSGFTLSLITQGVNDSTDPAPGGTGIMVTILENDDADTVASKTQSVVNGHFAFTASVALNVVSVLNVAPGNVTDATAGTSGFTVVVVQGTTQPPQEYKAVIIVDGVEIEVIVDGDTSDTFTNLLGQINTALGAAATAAIVGGNIEITSATVGSGGSVECRGFGIFPFTDGYVEHLRPVPGAADTMEAARVYITDNGESIYDIYRYILAWNGDKPKWGNITDITVAYWDGTSWLRYIDDTAV